MAIFYNSNCSTLSVGCFLYNGPGLTNPVSNGYYSDGVNCYTVTGGNGYISSISVCSSQTFVTITSYVPSSMICFSFDTFAAVSDYIVDTNVQVQITWNGDLGGFETQTVTIISGTNCGSTSFSIGGGISCFGENYSSDSIIITPSSFGNQIYLQGSTNTTGLYPC